MNPDIRSRSNVTWDREIAKEFRVRFTFPGFPNEHVSCVASRSGRKHPGHGGIRSKRELECDERGAG
jgi:hypothetical protein